MNAQGVIATLSEKEWQDRDTGEDIVLHSFQLEGNNKWFRTGTDPIGFDQGEAISFDYNPRSGQVIMNTVEGIDPSTVERAPAPRRATAGRTGSYKGAPRKQYTPARGTTAAKPQGGSRDDYWKDKEARDLVKEKRYQEVIEPRIVVMAAQERAVNLLGTALQHECVSFGNANKGKKLEMLLGFTDELTTHFVQQALSAHQFVRDVGVVFDDEIPFGDEGINDD